MYGRPPSSRPGPPAPFVPASQQQRGARAIPIIAPSNDASPETKAAFAKQLAATSGSGGNVNGSAISATSPAKGALSAKAASAAVFIPKGISTPSTTNATPATFSNSTSENAYDDQQANNNAMMHDMNLNGPQEQQHFIHHQSPAIQNNLFLGNESGRGTPNSFGVGGGYDTDGSNSMFDPTYMGPLPNQQNSQEVQGSGNTNINSGAATVQPQGGKAYNPYEHLNEYGEPTNGGALMPGAGQMGLDYYGTSGQHGNASASVKLRQPLQYHLYNPPMPHVSNLHPQHLSANAFFMSDEEREELQRKNEALHAGVPPPELGGPKLPEELHVYHSLVPLEHGQIAGMQGSSLVPQLINPRLVSPTAPQTVYQLTGATGEASRVFGYRCHVYKAQCTLDGKYYVLRRLENFRLSHEAAIGLVERWRRIRHPSIVSVREAFTTRAFGDSSIVFVYDYHPLASTLYAEHMIVKPPQPDRRTGRMQTRSMQIHERTLWSYLCQLTNVIRTIHQHGLAARCIEPSKVLLTAKNRIRINCCSIFDVIAYDPNASQSALQEHQAEDLINIGRLILSLACNSVSAVQNIQRSLDQIARVYSADLKSVIVWLISPSGNAPLPTLNNIKVTSTKEENEDEMKTAEGLQRILGVKYSEEFDSALNHNDLLESGLGKELENARLVRLLCKFGFINERPAFDHDPRWSESGDRYIVKLFRDHVFHAVDPAGRPVVDLTHILTNLNKLDAGSLEKIMLTSRDEQSCLVVSYREIKNCIDSAFADLSRSR